MATVLQRLRRTLRPPTVAFVYHRDYARSIGPVPFDPDRPTEILAFLLDRGLIDRADVSQPDPASLDDLLRVHTPAYLETLQRPNTMEGIFGAPLADDEAQEVVERQRLVVGGTIRAARLALGGGRRRIAAHLAGGMHHAAPDRGMGFCVFNDVGVAIRALRADGFADPILVVDLDLHDGNGTRAVFAADPTVWTFSIHNAPWDDGQRVASTAVALGSGVTDAAFLAALRRELPPVVAAHRPALVFYVAGTDVAADDRLGDWKLTADGILARDAFVAGVARGTPLVVLLGGGYGAGAWRHSARFFAWLLSARRVDPPDDMTLVLSRFRPVAREFATPARAAATDRTGNEWGLTQEDLDILAPGAPRETRVLGHFSPLGLELLLDRLGVLAKLRDRGFARPVVDVDFTSTLGPTVRIWGDPDRRDLLVELRINRSRTAVPGMEVLSVEWLLLQNPRRRFGGAIRPLPGQQHPGLGLLREVIGLLVAVCEMLRLDGVVYLPAQYYLAVLGQRYMRCLSPADQGRLEALQTTLAGLSLADAGRALAEGRVVDAATGAAQSWPPVPVVLPVSARLRAAVGGPAYDEAVRRARERLRFRLVSAQNGVG
ncbi:MAG: hypothetical protein ACREMR_05305 [Gemmatimonadales bacterium]